MLHPRIIPTRIIPNAAQLPIPGEKPKRIPGVAVSPEVRRTWSLSKLVTELRKFIRSDYGGASTPQDKALIAFGRFLKDAKDIKADDRFSQLSQQDQIIFGNILLKYDEVLINGIRKRCNNCLDDLEDRVNGF